MSMSLPRAEAHFRSVANTDELGRMYDAAQTNPQRACTVPDIRFAANRQLEDWPCLRQSPSYW